MELAVLTDIIKETKSNWRFIFESPLYDEIKFTPGQLVQLVAKPYGPSEGVDSIQRNYSVASWPDGSNQFELIITYLKGGKMSEYLFNEAKIGDEFAYRGPMGIFTLPEKIDRDIFFVSTGSAGYVDFNINPIRAGMKTPVKCWIHTHPFGSAYFSGTDIRTVRIWKPLMETAYVLGGEDHFGFWFDDAPNELEIWNNGEVVRTQTCGTLGEEE